MRAPRISRLGEHAWLIAFEPRLDAEVNASIVALAERVRRQRWPGLRDVVPGAATLAVHFAPDAKSEGISESLGVLAAAHGADHHRPASLVEVPVCYGGEFGPDLVEVAQRTSLSVDEVVRRHLGVEYRVFMLGFLPGFPYLGVVDPALEVNRRAEPRSRVPAGSVGLAGQQTGIYPSESPGGWQIIGRTPLRLFDASSTPPTTLHAGDRVRFVAVGRDAFGERPPASSPGPPA